MATGQTYTPSPEAQEARLKPAYGIMELAKEGQGKARFIDGPKKGQPPTRSWLNRRLANGQFPNAWLDDSVEPQQYRIPGRDLAAHNLTYRDTWRDYPDEQPTPPSGESRVTVRGADLAAAAMPAVDAAVAEAEEAARRYLDAKAAEAVAPLDGDDVTRTSPQYTIAVLQFRADSLQRRVDALEETLRAEQEAHNETRRQLLLAERQAAENRVRAEERERTIEGLHRAYGVRELEAGQRQLGWWDRFLGRR